MLEFFFSLYFFIYTITTYKPENYNIVKCRSTRKGPYDKNICGVFRNLPSLRMGEGWGIRGRRGEGGTGIGMQMRKDSFKN